MFPLPRPRSGAQEEVQLLQKSFSVCTVVHHLLNAPKVSSVQAGGGSDPPEREDASNLLSEWSVCVHVSFLRCMYKCVSVLPLQLMKLL